MGKKFIMYLVTYHHNHHHFLILLYLENKAKKFSCLKRDWTWIDEHNLQFSIRKYESGERDDRRGLKIFQIVFRISFLDWKTWKMLWLELFQLFFVSSTPLQSTAVTWIVTPFLVMIQGEKFVPWWWHDYTFPFSSMTNVHKTKRHTRWYKTLSSKIVTIDTNKYTRHKVQWIMSLFLLLLRNIWLFAAHNVMIPIRDTVLVLLNDCFFSVLSSYDCFCPCFLSSMNKNVCRNECGKDCNP